MICWCCGCCRLGIQSHSLHRLVDRIFFSRQIPKVLNYTGESQICCLPGDREKMTKKVYCKLIREEGGKDWQLPVSKTPEVSVSGACCAPVPVYIGEASTQPTAVNLAEEQREETGIGSQFTLIIFWAKPASQVTKPECAWLLPPTQQHWPLLGDCPTGPSYWCH